ncbi:MAG: glycosyltransferase [Clostridia bacterium]
MNKIISIVIPVFNAESYLEKCLDSILSQTYKDIEIVCINDGSTDSSGEILAKYKGKYKDKLNVITIENEGQSNARNVGIQMAKGDFISFVDSDDSLDKTMMQKLYDSMKKDNSDLAFCDIDRIVEGKTSALERIYKYDISISFKGVTTIKSNPEIICYLTAAPFAKLIKKEVLLNNNITFKKGFIYEDLLFCQQILATNPNISMVNEKLYKYLVRNNSTMTSKKSRVCDMFEVYDDIFKTYQKNNLDVTFKKELDFLCLYHIMIGTSFRMVRSKQFSLFESLKKCRAYVKKYDCNKKNIYIKSKGIVSRIFLFITLIGV